MKALNNKERNSAIFRFSIWLFISVLIICMAVVLILFLPLEKGKLINKACQDELAQMTRETQYEQDTFAVQIRTILELMNKIDANETKIETFNMELMNVISNIDADTSGKVNWRGEMYNNISAISKRLIEANKIIIRNKENTAGQSDKLGTIILELQSCGEEITELCDENNRRDFHSGIKKVNSQFKRALKKLEAYQ